MRFPVMLWISALWPTRATRWAAGALAGIAITVGAALVIGQADWADQVAERTAKGRKPRLEDYVQQGQWHAAVFSTVACLGLAATTRFWLGDRRPAAARAGEVPSAGGGGRQSGFFWAGVLVCVVAGAWVRVPRLTHSLYNDEEYMFRRYVAGEHKRLENGHREWRPVPWLGTLWGNQMANNPVAYSLAARACYDWAVARGHAAATLPAEWPLRFPAFLAGLGSLVAVAWLARHLCSPAAGVTAAALAALHPWHVRYSTEARGHSFLLLLAPLLPLALDRAVHTGRWRWWLAFGVLEVLFLWSFAGAVHYLIAFNFLALIWLWWRPGGAWRTFLAVQGGAAVIYVHLMAPCFPQMREALTKIAVFSSGFGGASWFANTGSFLLAGLPWPNANPELADHPSMQALWGGHPLVLGVLFAAITVVLVIGVGRLWSVAMGRILVLSLPLGAGLAVTASMVSGAVLFSWYVLFLLPGVLIVAAIGLTTLVEKGWLMGGGRRLGVLGVAAVPVAGWIWFIASPLATYRQMGKQALRDVARFLHAPCDGVVPLAALYRSEAIAYDPSLTVIDEDPVAALRSMAVQAETDGRPLLVGFGYRPLIAKSAPEFLEFVETSGQFEQVAHFPGLEEPQFAHYIWRWRPRPGPSE